MKNNIIIKTTLYCLYIIVFTFSISFLYRYYDYNNNNLNADFDYSVCWKPDTNIDDNPTDGVYENAVPDDCCKSGVDKKYKLFCNDRQATEYKIYENDGWECGSKCWGSIRNPYNGRSYYMGCYYGNGTGGASGRGSRNNYCGEYVFDEDILAQKASQNSISGNMMATCHWDIENQKRIIEFKDIDSFNRSGSCIKCKSTFTSCQSPKPEELPKCNESGCGEYVDSVYFADECTARGYKAVKFGSNCEEVCNNLITCYACFKEKEYSTVKVSGQVYCQDDGGIKYPMKGVEMWVLNGEENFKGKFTDNNGYYSVEFEKVTNSNIWIVGLENKTFNDGYSTKYLKNNNNTLSNGRKYYELMGNFYKAKVGEDLESIKLNDSILATNCNKLDLDGNTVKENYCNWALEAGATYNNMNLSANNSYTGFDFRFTNCENQSWIKTSQGIVYSRDLIKLELPSNEYFANKPVFTGSETYSIKPNNLYITSFKQGGTIGGINYYDDTTNRINGFQYTYDDIKLSLSQTNTIITDPVIENVLNRESGVFEVFGDSIISENRVCNGNKVIFINGNLTVSPNFTKEANSACMFIISGDLNIDQGGNNTDEQIHGGFLVFGKLNIFYDDFMNTLLIKGFVYVMGLSDSDRGILIYRNNNDLTYPVIEFRFDPRYVVLSSVFFNKNRYEAFICDGVNDDPACTLRK